MSWSEWCCFPTPGPQHGLWSSANTKHGGTSITSQRLLKAPRTGEGLASGVWSTGALTLTAPPGSLTQATHFPASTPGPGLRIPQTSARGSLCCPGHLPAPLHQGCTWADPGCGWAWPGAQSSPGQVNRREAGVKTCQLRLQPVCLSSQPPPESLLWVVSSVFAGWGDPTAPDLPTSTGALLPRHCPEKGLRAVLFLGLEASA